MKASLHAELAELRDEVARLNKALDDAVKIVELGADEGPVYCEKRECIVASIRALKSEMNFRAENKKLATAPMRVRKGLSAANIKSDADLRALFSDRKRLLDLLRHTPNFGSASFKWLCEYVGKCPSCVRGICHAHKTYVGRPKEK